jgi:hypothetical protein
VLAATEASRSDALPPADAAGRCRRLMPHCLV